jgi:hypothetical protein
LGVLAAIVVNGGDELGFVEIFTKGHIYGGFMPL